MENVSIGIVNKDNKILMIKRAKQEGNLVWAFPGGKVEIGETKEEACIREVYEETGVIVSIVNLMGERIHPNTGTTITYYLCQYEKGDIRTTSDEEILEVAYKTREEFFREVKTDVYEPVKEYILHNIE